MAVGINPTKVWGSDKFAPRISQMIYGMSKENPPTMKKLPVEVDVPEYIAKAGRDQVASPLTVVVGDLTFIAFYYLLCIGEYMVKGESNKSNQKKQFKLSDVKFFYKNKYGQLRQL